MALGKCSNYYDCMQFTPKLSGLKQGWYLFFFMSLPFGVSSTELVYLGPIWCQVRWLEARGLELSEGFLTCLVIDVVSWDLSLGCQLGQLKSQLTTSMTSHVAWAPPWHRGCVPRVNISKEVSQVEAVFSLWPSPGSHVALLLPCWRTQSQLPNRLKGRKRGSQSQWKDCWLGWKKSCWCDQLWAKKVCHKRLIQLLIFSFFECNAC